MREGRRCEGGCENISFNNLPIFRKTKRKDKDKGSRKYGRRRKAKRGDGRPSGIFDDMPNIMSCTCCLEGRRGRKYRTRPVSAKYPLWQALATPTHHAHACVAVAICCMRCDVHVLHALLHPAAARVAVPTSCVSTCHVPTCHVPTCCIRCCCIGSIPVAGIGTMPPGVGTIPGLTPAPMPSSMPPGNWNCCAALALLLASCMWLVPCGPWG